MAPSPQKASWRRIDTALISSDDVEAGGNSSASGQQSSPLAGHDVSSTPGYSQSPLTTLQTSSSPSITISPSSLFPSPTSSSTISTPPSSTIGFTTSTQPLSDGTSASNVLPDQCCNEKSEAALSPTNTQSIFSSFGKPTLAVSSLGSSSFVVSDPLASSGSQPGTITKPLAAPVALVDVIIPSSPVVQSTLHTIVDSTLPASTPFRTPQIGPSPPVSFGGDVPANSADSGFSSALDVTSPAIPTPTGGLPQGITAATEGLVDTSIPNGETISPGPLTSALPSGEIGVSTITVPTTTAISTIPPSIISGVSQIDLFADHRPFGHDNFRFRTTSLFTTTTEVVSYSLTEISGLQTSIPITKKIPTVLPTVVPVHSHRSPNRSVPVAVIAAPILSVAVIIALVLVVLRRHWRLQHQRIQARFQWPTFVGFSQVREMHHESMLRSREEGPPSLPPLQSTVGWNDPSPGAFAFGEPAQDPFAPTPPMIFRPLPDASSPLDRPLSIRTIRRVPVPDPFLGSSGRTSSLAGSPEGLNRLSQTSSHDEHPHVPTNSNNVGWAV